MIEYNFYQFNIEDCIRDARSLVDEMAKIGDSKNLRLEAEKALEIIRPKLTPQAVCSRYSRFDLDGGMLTIIDGKGTGHTVQCKAFAQIDSDIIREVWVFALTAGDCSTDSDRIMTQLFADYWGTAITETVRKKLMAEIKKEVVDLPNGKGDISEFFGPGLYGMDIAEMRKLPLLCDFEKAGICVSDSCCLMPEKSAAGLVFVVIEGYERLGGRCEQCEGNAASCSLCAVKND